MPSGPPLHSYQILSKYVLVYQSYEGHKDASTDGHHADRYIPPPEPIGQGMKMTPTGTVYHLMCVKCGYCRIYLCKGVIFFYS